MIPPTIGTTYPTNAEDEELGDEPYFHLNTAVTLPSKRLLVRLTLLRASLVEANGQS